MECGDEERRSRYDLAAFESVGFRGRARGPPRPSLPPASGKGRRVASFGKAKAANGEPLSIG